MTGFSFVQSKARDPYASFWNNGIALPISFVSGQRIDRIKGVSSSLRSLMQVLRKLNIKTFFFGKSDVVVEESSSPRAVWVAASVFWVSTFRLMLITQWQLRGWEAGSVGGWQSCQSRGSSHLKKLSLKSPERGNGTVVSGETRIGQKGLRGEKNDLVNSRPEELPLLCDFSDDCCLEIVTAWQQQQNDYWSGEGVSSRFG